MTKQKYIFCLLETALGLWFLIMAGLSFYDARNEIKRLQVESVNAKLQPMSFFLTSAFQITMTLQLFNWFSKRTLGTVLGIWLATQSLGLMSKFLILNVWSYFPDFEEALFEQDASLTKKYAYLQLVVSICFLILAVIDSFHFYFHPFEVAVVVDMDEKTHQDRALLRKLQMESENENHLISSNNSKV